MHGQKVVVCPNHSPVFSMKNLYASYSQLVDKSEETLRSIAISTEQAKSLELLTRGQSHSKLRSISTGQDVCTASKLQCI